MSLKSFIKDHREVVSYLVFGALCTLVNFIVSHICMLFFDSKNAGGMFAIVAISWVASVTFAFITNRKFVFKSKSKNIKREALSFYLGRLGTLGMDYGIRFLLITLAHWNFTLVWLIVQIVVVIFNYVFSKKFVFRKTRDKIDEINRKY